MNASKSDKTPTDNANHDLDRPLTVAEARAQVEAQRGQKRSEERALLEAFFTTQSTGMGAVYLSWAGTIIFTLVAVIAVISGVGEDAAAQLTWFFIVSMGMFGFGSIIFAIAVMIAIARSRFYYIGIGGLFFLVGSAPRKIQVHLLSSFAIQLVVSIVAASIHPFTPLAFGTLAPVYGLAICGLWGARFGMFSEKEQ